MTLVLSYPGRFPSSDDRRSEYALTSKRNLHSLPEAYKRMGYFLLIPHKRSSSPNILLNNMTGNQSNSPFKLFDPRMGHGKTASENPIPLKEVCDCWFFPAICKRAATQKPVPERTSTCLPGLQKNLQSIITNRQKKLSIKNITRVFYLPGISAQGKERRRSNSSGLWPQRKGWAKAQWRGEGLSPRPDARGEAKTGIGKSVQRSILEND